MQIFNIAPDECKTNSKALAIHIVRTQKSVFRHMGPLWGACSPEERTIGHNSRLIVNSVVTVVSMDQTMP